MAATDPQQPLELMGGTSMQTNRTQNKGNAIYSAAQVLPAVRRRMMMDMMKVTVLLAVLAIAPYLLSGETKLFYLAPFSLVVIALLTYTGRYIPISNKHDSLVRKYGDIYVKEVAAAVDEHGFRTLLRTRWFETYADENCRRSSRP